MPEDFIDQQIPVSTVPKVEVPINVVEATTPPIAKPATSVQETPVTGALPLTTPPTLKKKNSKFPFLILAILVLLGLILFGAYSFFFTKNTVKESITPSRLIRIGLSLDTLKELRWTQDRDLITERAKQLGASTMTLVANSSDETQISQIQNFIAQKVDVLIIVAHNAKALSGVVDQAHKAGIKIIAYDRMILNSNTDLYISFDSTMVGTDAARYVMEAIPNSVKEPNVAFIGGSETDNNAFLVKTGVMTIIDPLVKVGKAKLVFNQFTPDWNPDIAYKNLNQFLNSGGKVDAVIASNDGTAMGAIQSLTEHGLAGKVPVSGQDAELSAVKRLISGTQTVTLYKPLRLEAFSAAENAVALASGKVLKTKAIVNNGKIDVPSVLLNPVPVTKDSIKDTVIKDGFYTSSEVYGSTISP